MAIKRVVVESNLQKRPFKDGETLFKYAQRILKEDGLQGMVLGVRSTASVVDVTTHGNYAMGGDSIASEELVEIEVRTAAMIR